MKKSNSGCKIHVQIVSWNQPVSSNEDNISCSRNQSEPLMGFEHTPDRQQLTRSQIHQPLCHVIPLTYYSIGKRGNYQIHAFSMHASIILYTKKSTVQLHAALLQNKAPNSININGSIENYNTIKQQ